MSADDTPYVCFSAMDWWYHSHAHSDFQLMQRIARSRRVLFVNTIGLRVPVPGRTPMVRQRVQRKVRSVAKLLRRPVPELPDFHVVTPVSLPVSGRGRAWNTASVTAQVRMLTAALGMRRPNVVVTLPTAWPIIRDLPHGRVLYNRCDKHSLFPGADQEAVAGLERSLLDHADHVLYVNRRLMAEEAPLTGPRAEFLDHGVDLEHFDGTSPPVPDDLAAIPRPRVGFIGALRDYTVDLDLIARLARDAPELNVVLVGETQCALDRVTSLPNVHWLGGRPYADIPAYAAGLDVAIMPWLENEWIRYCNPIKLKEHLAMGLPVVTTAFGDADDYDRWIRVASDPADFVAQVRRTVRDGGVGTPASRREAVADASWDRRAAELLSLAEQGSVPY